MAAYEAAMKGEVLPRKEIGESRSQPGTIAALVAAYFSSPQFKGLSASTQATYRGIIERFRREHGHRRIATLQRDKLAEMLGNRAATPTAARPGSSSAHGCGAGQPASCWSNSAVRQARA